jgi:hypothetical protein
MLCSLIGGYKLGSGLEKVIAGVLDGLEGAYQEDF